MPVSRVIGVAAKGSRGMILETIDSPADLRDLSIEQLRILAGEIRDEMWRVVNQNGGHLGAGLGVVELTLALHRTFLQRVYAYLFNYTSLHYYICIHL
jgi:1-deoxy-D-xylulose-5-phosphate synthase